MARKQTLLLIIGLFLSITLLLVGSAIISSLMRRLPWLILVAAGTLAITAAQLIIQDTNVLDYLLNQSAVGPVTYVGVIAIMLMPFFIWVRNYNSSS